MQFKTRPKITPAHMVRCVSCSLSPLICWRQIQVEYEVQAQKLKMVPQRRTIYARCHNAYAYVFVRLCANRDHVTFM